MAEKMTRVTLPGSPQRVGLMDYGEVSAADIIAQLRSHHEQQKADAELVLNSPDSAFQVDVVRGSIVQHFVKTLQQAEPPVKKEGE